ncbi:MAG: bifunctional helix-turn-helix transcriptional regulator/GNAT family N-acetyltransferase [Shimia sp.]|uniref:bifunctional helix-turn-helix transcriptional regulator/GNAT family N-acetyltransferase n=1 Tax=Shimia sp. TaxID=1954381 RepID=UPI00405960DB
MLDQSYLGRGRSLGPALVLHAIGPDGAELETVRSYLGLDKTLLSRFLKSLQDDGMVVLQQDPNDGRRRIATLTESGRAEHIAYNALSDAQANTMLARHPRAEALLDAMDLIGSALGRDDITFEQVDPRCEDALYCLHEYYGELDRRIAIGFDVNLSADPDATDMMPPRGTFLLAMSDGLPLGCVGLKGTDKGYAEVKRLWIAPSARGLGLAKRMMEQVEAAARDLGISLLRLDTNSKLGEAVKLYETSGWTQIERFNDDPYPDVFFERAV